MTLRGEGVCSELAMSALNEQNMLSLNKILHILVSHYPVTTPYIKM